MTDWKRFGDPTRLALGLSWADAGEPPERRPAAYGWSMGHLSIGVAGVNVTATKLGAEQQQHVGWYLAPFLDWLATSWASLLHEERLPWPNAGAAPAAIACNRALDEWIDAEDQQGRRHYANVQDWYFRHGLRSAAAGGIYPDLFIRRIADDIELSWSGTSPAFAPEGLAFESGVGHARLPVREVAETLWQALEWAVDNPPKSPARYQNQIAALRSKVKALRDLDCLTLARAHVPVALLPKVETALVAINRSDLLADDASNDVPYIAELPPAVAMFGGVSPDLGARDIEYLRDLIVKAEGGNDAANLATLVADRHGNTLGVPHENGRRFADDLLEDLGVPDNDAVDVRAMCADLAIDIQETTLQADSIRGVAVAGDGFAPQIAINRTHHFNLNESGKRFTIAHELCHVLYDRTRARRVTHASSGPWAAQGIEQRANAFAAYLLMPRTLVLAHLTDANDITLADVRYLASQLQVNETALSRHLYNLGLVDWETSERLRDEVGRERLSTDKKRTFQR